MVALVRSRPSRRCPPPLLATELGNRLAPAVVAMGVTLAAASQCLSELSDDDGEAIP